MEKFSKSTIQYFFLKDEEAVREIYIKTYRLLFHIAFSYLQNLEDSEDIVSLTYQKMLNYDESRIKDSDEFIRLICKICKNSALDFLKRNKYNSNLELDENMVPSEEHYSLILDDFQKILTKDQYDVFIYKAYYELSYKEISSLINKTETRCRGIFLEAKKIIKDHKEMFL